MRRLLGVAALLCASALALTPASAQPNKGDSSTAIALAKDAKERFDQRKFAEAYVLFETAEAKAHSPVLVLYMARCKRELGELLAARALYRKVASEELPPTAVEPFHAAVADGRRELSELDAQIPKLTVTLVDLPIDASVEIDGAPVSRQAAEAGVEVDPGQRVVVAKHPDGSAITSATVEVSVGGDNRVKLSLSPQQPTEPLPKDGVVVPHREPGSLVPGAVLLGVGGAALAAAIGTRVAAFGIVDDVKSRCEGNRCLAEDEAEIDRAKTLEIASTVCFAVGGAVAATGIILMIVRPGGDDTTTVSLDLRPGGVRLFGSF